MPAPGCLPGIVPHQTTTPIEGLLPCRAYMGSTHVCFGSEADLSTSRIDVRSTANNGHDRASDRRPLSAITGLMHRSKRHPYSITSSANARRLGGNSRLSARAVFKFTSISNPTGCSTGSSAGLAPFRILST